MLGRVRPACMADLCGKQHSFFQMTSHVRVGRGVGIVRHHHDRLLKILVQSLQDFQYFGSGVAVEISGGFVRQQQCRVADDGAGDCHTLFLSAGELFGK